MNVALFIRLTKLANFCVRSPHLHYLPFEVFQCVFDKPPIQKPLAPSTPESFFFPGDAIKSVAQFMSEICPGLYAAAKITIFVENWKNLRVDENMSKRAPTRSAIFAKTAKITIFAKKLEKSSSPCKHVKEGPDKVCDFCDFCENCENYNFCKKLEKSSSR